MFASIAHLIYQHFTLKPSRRYASLIDSLYIIRTSTVLFKLFMPNTKLPRQISSAGKIMKPGFDTIRIAISKRLSKSKALKTKNCQSLHQNALATFSLTMHKSGCVKLYKYKPHGLKWSDLLRVESLKTNLKSTSSTTFDTTLT